MLGTLVGHRAVTAAIAVGAAASWRALVRPNLLGFGACWAIAGCLPLAVNAGGSASETLGAAAASERFVVWEPTPFTARAAAPASEALARRQAERAQRQMALEERWATARRLAQQLDKYEELLESKELRSKDLQMQIILWREDLARRERGLVCQREEFRRSWAEQETSLLHLIVFHLVRIQAAVDGTVDGTVESPMATVRSGAAAEQWGPVHPRWLDVEVVTCIPGSVQLVAGEIPVYNIIRASSPLPMRNLCEETDGNGHVDTFALFQLVYGFLTKIRKEEELVRARVPSQPPILFVVVSGVNLFFNELQNATVGGGAPASWHAARKLAERYEAVISSEKDDGMPSSDRPVVAATERLCRHQADDSPCSPEEALPPHLYAGGVAGPAGTLEPLIRKLLLLGSKAANLREAYAGDATTLLRRIARTHPSEVVPDTRQRLFGSLAEVAVGPCLLGSGGRSPLPRTTLASAGGAAGGGTELERPSDRSFTGGALPGVWCYPEPCCPTGSDFDRLHEAYSANYHAEGCTLFRLGEAPILWHGDGLAKWTYVLAIYALAHSCHRVARLVLMSHPVDMLDHLFRRFAALQQPGSAAPEPRGS